MDAKRLLDDSIPNAGEMPTFLLLRDQFRQDKWCLIAWKYAFYAHFFIGIISIKLQSDCVKYCKCLLIDLIPDQYCSTRLCIFKYSHNLLIFCSWYWILKKNNVLSLQQNMKLTLDNCFFLQSKFKTYFQLLFWSEFCLQWKKNPVCSYAYFGSNVKMQSLVSRHF